MGRAIHNFVEVRSPGKETGPSRVRCDGPVLYAPAQPADPLADVLSAVSGAGLHVGR